MIPDRQTLRVYSPAKLNIGLEVLGKRDDGFHDIVTIMQAISLLDVFELKPDGQAFRYGGLDTIPRELDMVQSVVAGAPDIAHWSGELTLTKQVPMAAGLGGGSSNAAIALRLAHPDMTECELREMASNVGSDVPFFLSGGCALASGRGVELEPLPDTPAWFVVVVPDLMLPRKTARMYGSLTASDMTSGARVRMYADALRNGQTIETLPPNAFERYMREYDAVERCWQGLAGATGQTPNLSGAGPAMYVRFNNERDARAASERLDRDCRRFLCRARERSADGEDALRMARALRGAGAND